MPRADFVFSLLLLALGLAAVVESWRMPRLQELGVNPMTAPGLTPGLLGLVIATLAVVLLVRSLRAGGWRLSGTRAPGEAAGHGDGDGRRAMRRVALSLLLTFGYAGGLVGRLNFPLATALFVLLFIAIFEWRPGESVPRRLRQLGVAAAIAALTAVCVTYLFENIFLVKLP